MKHLALIIAAAAVSLAAQAQPKAPEQPKEPEYQFTTVKELPITSIKNQYRSGTCWCFSTLSFIESELLRTQNKEYDLSEMWVVSRAYSDRATKYVRMDGHMGFSAGSGFGDVFAVFNKYGIVPQSAYPGMQYGTELPEQAEMDAVLKAYVDAIVKVPNKTCLSTAWKKGFDATVQAYQGEWPAEFELDGKKYTPATYRDEVIKFNSSDYVNFCSFASEPWYDWCPIEVCDNWRNANGYNVPLEDMMRIIYCSLDEGYTVLWGGDVSEKGFTRNGIGIMPVEKKTKPAAGSDQEHWVGKDNSKDEAPAEVELPKEVEVNDALRQDAFERKMTTDDHGMHIYGYATDQNGTKYFMVKNSWGDAGKYKGIWYMSDTFVGYKTLNVVINKNALPKDIKKKLGIK